MEAILIGCVVNENSRTIFVNDCVWSACNDNVSFFAVFWICYPFQCAFFIVFFTTLESLTESETRISIKLVFHVIHKIVASADRTRKIDTYSKAYSPFGSWWKVSSTTKNLDWRSGSATCDLACAVYCGCACACGCGWNALFWNGRDPRFFNCGAECTNATKTHTTTATVTNLCPIFTSSKWTFLWTKTNIELYSTKSNYQLNGLAQTNLNITLFIRIFRLKWEEKKITKEFKNNETISSGIE